MNFRVVDNFSIRAEFLSRISTGAHTRNENNLAYPVLMTLGGDLSFYYQFEFEAAGNASTARTLRRLTL